MFICDSLLFMAHDYGILTIILVLDNATIIKIIKIKTLSRKAKL